MTRESTTSRRRRLKLLAIPVAVVSAIAVVATGLVTGPGQAASRSAVPNNTAPPTISGTTTEGQALTANKGTWTGTEPITYSYQWRRCDGDGGSCSNIGGAKSSTYTLKAVDVGNTLRVVVSAKNSDGTRTATSVPSAVVKAAAAPPPSNGCGKATNGTIAVADSPPPARLARRPGNDHAEHRLVQLPERLAPFPRHRVWSERAGCAHLRDGRSVQPVLDPE